MWAVHKEFIIKPRVEPSFHCFLIIARHKIKIKLNTKKKKILINKTEIATIPFLTLLTPNTGHVLLRISDQLKKVVNVWFYDTFPHWIMVTYLLVLLAWYTDTAIKVRRIRKQFVCVSSRPQ